jgi:hypothetical protein
MLAKVFSSSPGLELASWMPGSQVSKVQAEPKITVSRNQQKAWVILEGPVDAETVIDSLNNVISRLDTRRIQLDFSKVTFFNELSLSALIVILRGLADDLSRITITGLESWALWRLRHAVYELRLGPDWETLLAEDVVFFRRRDELSSGRFWEDSDD